METTQGKSLCSYLYLKQAKTSFLSFYVFFFYKTGEQEGGTDLGGRLTPVGEGRWQGKG
jgi:hypothetical protein